MDLRVKNFKKGEYIDQKLFNEIRDCIRKQLNLRVKFFIVKQFVNDRYYLLDILLDFYNTKYSPLRGSIYDAQEKRFFLVSDVYPKEEVVYTPLREQTNDQNITYYRGYDGCVLRIFQIDGKIVFSTNRCINTRNNKIFSIKNSRTFGEIMKEVGGVNEENEKILFEGENKDKIHFFLIVTQETQLFMQGDIEEKVFYIGSKDKYEIGNTKKLNLLENFGKISHFEPITVSEANKILGFKDSCDRNIDPRLDMENSGFIIKETSKPYSKTFLYSEGYYWRKIILGLKRSDKIVSIYLELKDKYINNIQEYKRLFPYIKIIQDGGRKKVISLEYPKYLTKEQLEENLINCLFLILPKVRKMEVFTLREFIKDVIKKMAILIKKDEIPKDKIYNDRINEFLEVVKKEEKVEDIEKSLENLEGEIIYLLGRILGFFE
jgi:hypothetical protein